MRSIVALAFFIVIVNAAPQKNIFEVIPILKSNHETGDDGAYSFDFVSADGTKRSESGNANGAKSGEWSFTFPDGTPAKFTFVADEAGYRPQSDLIPAIPDFVLEQIAKAKRERDAGIVDDGQYKTTK